mmetsp:Transcript_5660/g.7349  ORF Transcript_5660/g.7349 Transcript_5660/m.7349 type:complete len:542 (+) Transcript_5660:225-1850(+)
MSSEKKPICECCRLSLLSSLCDECNAHYRYHLHSIPRKRSYLMVLRSTNEKRKNLIQETLEKTELLKLLERKNALNHRLGTLTSRLSDLHSQVSQETSSLSSAKNEVEERKKNLQELSARFEQRRSTLNPNLIQKLDEQYKGNLDLLQVARCTKVEQLRNFYPLVWEGREIESQINAAKKNETTTTDNAPSTVSKRKKRSESLPPISHPLSSEHSLEFLTPPFIERGIPEAFSASNILETLAKCYEIALPYLLYSKFGEVGLRSRARQTSFYDFRGTSEGSFCEGEMADVGGSVAFFEGAGGSNQEAYRRLQSNIFHLIHVVCAPPSIFQKLDLMREDCPVHLKENPLLMSSLRHLQKLMEWLSDPDPSYPLEEPVGEWKTPHLSPREEHPQLTTADLIIPNFSEYLVIRQPGSDDEDVGKGNKMSVHNTDEPVTRIESAIIVREDESSPLVDPDGVERSTIKNDDDKEVSPTSATSEQQPNQESEEIFIPRFQEYRVVQQLDDSSPSHDDESDEKNSHTTKVAPEQNVQSSGWGWGIGWL